MSEISEKLKALSELEQQKKDLEVKMQDVRLQALDEVTVKLHDVLVEYLTVSGKQEFGFRFSLKTGLQTFALPSDTKSRVKASNGNGGFAKGAVQARLIHEDGTIEQFPSAAKAAKAFLGRYRQQLGFDQEDIDALLGESRNWRTEIKKFLNKLAEVGIEVGYEDDGGIKYTTEAVSQGL